MIRKDEVAFYSNINPSKGRYVLSTDFTFGEMHGEDTDNILPENKREKKVYFIHISPVFFAFTFSIHVYPYARAEDLNYDL